MSLTILLGDYGAGKTTTAKYLARITGGTYLNFDLLSQGNNKNGYSSIIDNLKHVIKPGIDYYLDGWTNYSGFNKSQLPGIDVKYIVCMVAPKIIAKRQKAKAKGVRTPLPRDEEVIISVTHVAASYALTCDENPLFADTTTRPVTFFKKENWLNRWMEIVLYSRLVDAGEYQDVELSDRTIVGLSESYKTWDRLRVMVDFRGKSVIDYGCNYGYFCFKAEEAGSINIIGVDESDSVIDIASTIGVTKSSRVKFIISKLNNYQPPYTDIILALNILHHLDYDNNVVSRMFNRAGMVVLEVPSKDISIVDVIARSHRFGTPVIASSHRDGRCVVIYSKAKLIVLPRKFEYHPRRVAFRKWFYRVVLRFLPKPHWGILKFTKRCLHLMLK